MAKRFSKHVEPKDLVVLWAHDYERLSEAEFQRKYGTPVRKPRAAAPSPLSLKDTAVAARDEACRPLNKPTFSMEGSRRPPLAQLDWPEITWPGAEVYIKHDDRPHLDVFRRLR